MTKRNSTQANPSCHTGHLKIGSMFYLAYQESCCKNPKQHPKQHPSGSALVTTERALAQSGGI